MGAGGGCYRACFVDEEAKASGAEAARPRSHPLLLRPRRSGSRVAVSSSSAVPSELRVWICGLRSASLLPPAPTPIFCWDLAAGEQGSS